jgi:nucleotide-binding universal stress UspA family protein
MRRRRRMVIRNIVAGYDGSEHAKRALAVASAIASEGVTLTVVSAIHLPGGGGHAVSDADETEVREMTAALKEAESIFADQGLTVRTIDGYGDPADVISDVARDVKADLIVVGTRGRNLAQQLLLGSVSAKLTHEAPCSVVVAR